MILTIPPRSTRTTFMDFPFAPDLDSLEADFVIIGMPYSDPYTMNETINDQTNAPTAVRQASERMSRGLDRWDFDLGGTLFDGKHVRVVDLGDIPGDPHNLRRHYELAEQAIRKVLAAGAFPITLGGDHGVPIPVLRGFADHGPITLVHIDAHLDWRDEVNGAREGYSSTIRRASQMKHITSVFQIGIRGQGSARAEEVLAAQRYGSNIITALEVRESGMQAILDRIPDGGRYYMSIDADGLDPAVMPAVYAPQPGGLSYPDIVGLIKGLCRKGEFVGLDIVEIVPSLDVNMITSITAGHIILNAIGAAVRAGRHA